MDQLKVLWQKYLRGELSGEETRQLLEAMEKEENRLLFSLLMKEEWEASEIQEKTVSDRKLLNKIRKGLGMKQQSAPPSRRTFIYTAAACLLLLLGGWWAFVQKDFIRLEVAAGQPASAFTLPDGSVIWLNSATVLEYRKDFTEARDIRLDGEAYFNVSPDSNHPFSVQFRNNKLVVTGTRFVIKSYAGEELSQVNVEEGSVKVYHDSGTTDLLRNNSLIIDENKDTATFHVSDFAGADSWKDGLLSFRNSSLDETLNTLERYYGIHIDTGTLSGTAATKHITATYPAGTSLKEVMNGLSDLLDLHYEFTGPGTLKIYETQDMEHP
ncbi:FecR family protein [Sinomicrobium weinanense]|uniref:FecR domain-containing protein n=1 Tax=Sinomicrobium weinanense TaxID=2842200 RepID=A0A926JV15_9FLAO|nr:FecR domain-containing protein [Sinomicrobium weinanense]MBC9798077.1 FecR domain-containing protein [Sinomicrobium weinanense]MBU3122561.1 FecR domain-containing protein [Sinomicrobium weinanense]